ncbi:hypothetical protein [Methylobacterium radiodurans]|uniref:Uncharacterized protein n=1 Tax=Methylobacterium radiodurans TaxID=2202828 RepID=A0A2U8VSW0_9HYPH|nr:hypothetical protein [Methylobacterium radiodurans]AWN36853.1 hypothetical protein DK427_14860 [Methylobacterium radiodurans]
MGRSWLRALRLAIRFGFPLAGLAVIGHAVVISVGGDIERWQFALGALLIALSFAARLVPRGSPQGSS